MANLVNKIKEWMVEDGLTSSDHNLIHMTIRGTSAAAMRDWGSDRNFNLRKAN